MLSIKISIEDAEKLDAVKMKPIVDRAKIRQLYEAGENPPDVSEIQFLQLYRVAPKEPVVEECPF